MKSSLRTTALVTEGVDRRLYALEDGTIIKVPKTKLGHSKSEMEFLVYGKLPEEIRKHICTIIDYVNGCIQVRKATSLASLESQGDIDAKDVERMIASKWFVVEYLENDHNVNGEKLTMGENWGILDGEIVILDFGCEI
jgi:hypothetical protein